MLGLQNSPVLTFWGPAYHTAFTRPFHPAYIWLTGRKSFIGAPRGGEYRDAVQSRRMVQGGRAYGYVRAWRPADDDGALMSHTFAG